MTRFYISLALVPLSAAIALADGPRPNPGFIGNFGAVPAYGRPYPPDPVWDQAARPGGPSRLLLQHQDGWRRLAELEAEQEASAAAASWSRVRPVRLPGVKPTPVSFPGTPAARQPEDYFAPDELKAQMNKLTFTKGDFRVVPYGAFWADMIYNTERTNPGPYTLYVLSAEEQGENEFIIDARRSRMGLDVLGPTIPLFCYASSGGRLEIDFFGEGTINPNRAGVLLRHAYWEVKNEDYRLLVGQTWDVVSPLYPGTLSYSVGWNGGNIGYRRAQFRAERYFRFSDAFMMEVQGSLNANVIPDFPASSDVIREPSGWPVVQGRLGWVLGRRDSGRDPLTLGLSAHISETGFDFLSPGPPPLNLPVVDDQRFRSWSLGVDFRVPVTDRCGVQGEFFTGANLSAFLGGVGQGVSRCLRLPIRSTGGWLDVWVDWTDRLHSHAGWGLDDPNDNDKLVGRVYNHFVFANVSFDVTKQFVTGLEVTSWKTLYQDTRAGQVPADCIGPTRPGEAVTFEWMVKYGF